MSEELKKEELENEELFEEDFDEEVNLPVKAEVKENFFTKTVAKMANRKIAKQERKAYMADLKLRAMKDPSNEDLKAQLKAEKKADALQAVKKVAIGGAVVGGAFIVATKVIGKKTTSDEETLDEDIVDVPVEEVSSDDETEE